MASEIDQTQPDPPDLEQMIEQAWPDERLQKLGPQQEKLLKGMLVTEQHPLSVPVLQGMLEQVEEYFPEELIGSLPSLEPLLKASSKAGE